MLMLLPALTLIIAALAYAVALCNQAFDNNPRCRYALSYCHVKRHPQRH